MLSEDQIRRYARHVLLPDIGGAGQARLLAGAARLRVGPARPAGAVALAYLAAAGVGTLILEDGAPGSVSEDEIPANILLVAEDVGHLRARALAARARSLNPDTEVISAASPRADAIEVAPAEPSDAADLAAALVVGGEAAVRALLTLAGAR